MQKLKRFLLCVLCASTVIVTDPAIAFAETGDEAQTAAKTVRVSSEDDQDPEEGQSDAETADNEDGASEKIGNYSIERMDITEMEEVRVGNYDEWCDFARKCELDTWSADKYVVLTDDIDFNLKTFVPVPYFAGVFDGNGHTVNKAAFTDEQNMAGIFSKTATTAVIRNVNIVGVIRPAGKAFRVGGIVGDNFGMIADCKYDGFVEGYDYIGGIAGYNETTGIISGCSVTGKITGLHYVGGICGANAGLVTGCSSDADINTVTKDVERGIGDIKVEEIFTSLINIGKEEGNKKSITSSNTPVDIGGIAGHNIGEISSSNNRSTVGYEHVGYNVGGIVGRQSGYIHDCSNAGYIQGRKDVGGIVGQAEPYIRLDLNSDIITQISKSIDKLHDSIDRTIKDTNSSSGVVSARLNVIKDFADKALGDTGYLANSTQDYVNGVVGVTNEMVGRIEYVIDEAAKSDGPVEDLADAGSNIKDAAGDLEKIAEDLNLYNYMDDSEKEQYDYAKDQLKESTKEFAGYFKEKKDELYPVYYDKKYYQILTGASELPDERPSKEMIEEAEKDKSEEELEKAKAEAVEYATVNAGADAEEYARTKYQSNHKESYVDDVEKYSTTIATTIDTYSDKMTEDARHDGKEAVSDIKEMANGIKHAGSKLRDILKTVADKSPVRFPELSEEYRMHTNSLVANIQGMSDNLGHLNNEMAGSTDTVCKDLEGVNDEFASMMLLFTDAMDGALDMDYSEVFEDDSNDVCEDSVDATVAGCVNHGLIYADVNTGGIAGTMAQEYDFDLEGDITGIRNAAKKSTYRTKCVFRDDKNTGEVKGRKSYVGGICGLHEIGTVLRCGNYAKVSSETSDYVGGIAGRSYSTIRDSYEKGVLAGDTNIGGIAGCGSDILNCIAMPVVTDGVKFTGAIEGSDDESGKIEGNLFVSETLAGIDRVSKAGRAEPITYRELLAIEGIPSEFSMMTIDFIVDGNIVATVQKRSGEVVSPNDTPVETEIAEKSKKKSKKNDDSDSDKVILEEDQYIDWDCDEEIPVYEDMEIKGEIVRFAGTLASEQLRGNKQSIFLVDGRFLIDEHLAVTSVNSGDADAEEYVIRIPNDGAASHRFRYQMPTGVKEVRIYVKSGSDPKSVSEADMEEVVCDSFGNYLTFEVPGNEVLVRAVSVEQRDYKLIMIIAGSVIGLLVLVFIARIVLTSRRRRKEIAAAKAAEAAGSAESSDALSEVEDISDDKSTDLPEELTSQVTATTQATKTSEKKN